MRAERIFKIRKVETNRRTQSPQTIAENGYTPLSLCPLRLRLVPILLRALLWVKDNILGNRSWPGGHNGGMKNNPPLPSILSPKGRGVFSEQNSKHKILDNNLYL